MSLRTPTEVAISGNLQALTAADALGDTFPAGSNIMLIVKNADAAPHTVTVNDTETASPAGAEAFDADVAVVVAAATTKYIGPFDRRRFGDIVTVNYDAVTSVTIEVLKLDLE